MVDELKLPGDVSVALADEGTLFGVGLPSKLGGKHLPLPSVDSGLLSYMCHAIRHTCAQRAVVTAWRASMLCGQNYGGGTTARGQND